MKKILVLLLLIPGFVQAQYLDIKPGAGLYLSNPKYKGGDTLRIRPGGYTYLSFNGLKGSPGKPIVIIPDPGAVFRDGLALHNCEYIHATGFVIRGATQTGTAFSIERKSKVIEVSNFNISNKTYGFVIKNEADCDQTINDWVIDSIHIHHGLVRDMGGQFIYAGSTNPSGGIRPKLCNGVNIYPRPSQLGNFEVHDNDINRTGRAAVQISNATKGFSLVYNNLIRNTGLQYDNTQAGAITFGGFTRGRISNNDIKYALGYGIVSQGGSGLVEIIGNTIDSVGYHQGKGEVLNWGLGISVETKPIIPVDSTTFHIAYNKIGVIGSKQTIHIAASWGTNTKYFTRYGNRIYGNGNAVVKVSPGIFYSAEPSWPKEIIFEGKTYLLFENNTWRIK